jgi:hypothetical protein
MGALLISDDLSVSAYNSKFHDGFLDDFLILDSQVIVFLRTDGDEEFTLGS